MYFVSNDKNKAVQSICIHYGPLHLARANAETYHNVTGTKQ